MINISSESSKLYFHQCPYPVPPRPSKIIVPTKIVIPVKPKKERFKILKEAFLRDDFDLIISSIKDSLKWS